MQNSQFIQKAHIPVLVLLEENSFSIPTPWCGFETSESWTLQDRVCTPLG